MKQYIPLYLRYRPQSLSELVGQEVVSRTLTNAIKYEKIVHAYLFCGPRGTGKTSSARILAKSLNCEKGPTPEPCGKCNGCISIIEGSSLDVIEIDAASHRKVEDAEDLINRVNLGTFGSRYKIYIIDEVHMLTDHAFNALLKTLEEPPKNVIFILATTEDHKVIQTIISRCQRLDFKPISKNELKGRIDFIAKKEKIKINEQILQFIAKRSNGCLRDAVSLLDQISVLQEGDKEIEASNVYDLFGTVDRVEMFKLLSHVLKYEKKQAIDFAEALVQSGKDISELLKSLIEVSIDLAKSNIDPTFKTQLSAEFDSDLSVLNEIKHNHLLKIIDSLHQGQGKLRFAISQELQFMTQIMILLDEDFMISLTELKEQMSEYKSSGGKQASTQVKPSVISCEGTEIKQKKQEELNEPLVTPSIEPVSENIISNLPDTWKKVIETIKSIPTRTLLLQSESHLMKVNPEYIEVGIGKDMFLPRLKQDEKKKEMILQAMSQVTGLNPQEIRYVLKKDDSQLIDPKSIKSIEETTPAQEFQSEDIESDEAKEINFSSEKYSNEPVDEFSQAMKDLLGAKQIQD